LRSATVQVGKQPELPDTEEIRIFCLRKKDKIRSLVFLVAVIFQTELRHVSREKAWHRKQFKAQPPTYPQTAMFVSRETNNDFCLAELTLRGLRLQQDDLSFGYSQVASAVRITGLLL